MQELEKNQEELDNMRLNNTSLSTEVEVRWSCSAATTSVLWLTPLTTVPPFAEPWHAVGEHQQQDCLTRSRA